jgi:hypothetical protein
MGKIVSASEIDRIFNLPKNSTRRDIHRHKLKAEKIGRDWLVDMDEATRLYGYRLAGLQNEDSVKASDE